MSIIRMYCLPARCSVLSLVRKRILDLAKKIPYLRTYNLIRGNTTDKVFTCNDENQSSDVGLTSLISTCGEVLDKMSGMNFCNPFPPFLNIADFMPPTALLGRSQRVIHTPV